jgi:hypothetical protein
LCKLDYLIIHSITPLTSAAVQGNALRSGYVAQQTKERNHEMASARTTRTLRTKPDAARQDDHDAAKRAKPIQKGRAAQGGHPVEGHPKSPRRGQ